jgi:hypothetical protein
MNDTLSKIEDGGIRITEVPKGPLCGDVYGEKVCIRPMGHSGEHMAPRPQTDLFSRTSCGLPSAPREGHAQPRWSIGRTADGTCSKPLPLNDAAMVSDLTLELEAVKKALTLSNGNTSQLVRDAYLHGNLDMLDAVRTFLDSVHRDRRLRNQVQMYGQKVLQDRVRQAWPSTA